jgi:two-component system, NarL family, nitrate/nitrite response regulator NarL
VTATYDQDVAVGAEVDDGILGCLSPRELQVLECISHGFTNAHTATDLRITTHAVKFHLASIYRKLGVANRTEATARYVSAVTRVEAHAGFEHR